MSENHATVKIIANMTKEYNDLDTRYKKLGVKLLTLMEVHKKTLKNEYNLTDKLKEQRLEIVEDISNVLHASEEDWREILEVLKEEWEGKK